MISIGGSSSRRRISATTQPTTSPIAIPPAAPATKSPLASSEREAAADGGGHRDAVGDERGRVVDQALALDDVDDPPRHAEPAQDRRGGDRVGGGDDRAERERRRPRDAVDQRVRDDRDRDLVASTRPIACIVIGRRLARRSRRSAKNAAE